MRAIEAISRKAALPAGYRLAVPPDGPRDFALIDVLPADCTKGRSLAEWATRQGHQRDEILAVGDNHNDLEMLQVAGIPVVMANGVPELKTHGWHETLSNDESGVAAAIERFALSEAACE